MSATRVLRSHLLSFLGFALMLPVAVPFAAADEDGKAGGDEKLSAEEKKKALEADVTQGALRVVKDDGTVVECPLRHTDVKGDVSGFIARVKVTQTFYNPTDERIEAVYVFPLPHEAAVDDMTMVIGKRKIVGIIKRRAEARQIYEQALAAGQTAALLEQERPNIFTQSVGNIDPAQEVNIEISYVDVLNYDMGTYEFHFPMVVGPRFIPGAPIGDPQPTPPELQGKVAPSIPDTTRVPDASRISPPVLKPGHRNGHDISLSLRLDAGVPIQGLKVANHEAEVVKKGKSRAQVTLSPADSIPNKDFVLRYHVMGKRPEMAVLSHTGDYTDARRLGHGYFMLMIQPKEDERLTKSPPREIVFLLDVSGSMRGHPTEKVKEAMRDMLKLCRDIDTMQVITFASRTQQLFEKPVPVNNANVAKALDFTRNIRGSGGTHMLEGVKRAIDQPIDEERVRIVIMLTDGYIGNEAEIIEHVGKSCGDQIRFWAIGIGSSPNMFLVDGVARQGGGMGKRLGLQDIAAGLAEEVITRIQRAQLAKINIDWGGLQVAETYPAKIPELWAGRPVILFGRYTGGGAAEIKVNGAVEGEAVSWPLRVTLPENQPSHDVLAKVWARKKIEDLMQQTYYVGSPAVEEEVTAIALDYRLMSQYTSFVAVDEKDAQDIAKERPAQPPRRMLVPVPLPEGTQWEGFFGPRGDGRRGKLELASRSKFAAGHMFAMNGLGRSGGMGGMGGGGFGSGVSGRPMPASQPVLLAGRALPTNMPAFQRSRQQAGQGMYRGLREQNRASASRRYLRAPMTPVAGPGFGTQPSRPAKGQPIVSFEKLAEEVAESDAAAIFEDPLAGLAPAALGVDTNEIAKAAQQLLEAGRAQLEKNEYDIARANLVRAYFLATAATNRGNYQTSQAASGALAELESLHSKQAEAWKEEVPALGTRLDLVLRDTSVGEALDAIAQAAKTRIRLIDGSIEDASDILAGRKVRVTYLNLRGATVAQALDWLLQPLRLRWQPEPGRGAGKTIVVGSDRRMPRITAWVYDVSTIALPTKEEFDKIEDRTKALAMVAGNAKQFIDAVRKALKASDEEVTWFAPGQLLVIGNTKTHGQTAEMFAMLSNPAAKPVSSLAALHTKTSARAQTSREQVRKVRELSRLMATFEVHGQFGWKLLAAALAGQVDDEALTELQIAWRAEETKKLLDGEGAGVALRSAWAITTASRLLPDHKEISAFANRVRDKCPPAAEKAVATLKDRPQELSAVLTAVYAAMTIGNTHAEANVLAALPHEVMADSPVAGALFAARGLLSSPHRIDGAQLGSLVAAGKVKGEDITVLVAMACHNAGGELWTAFRAEMKDLLGKQPLPGSVVVLINRLSGNAPQLVMR